MYTKIGEKVKCAIMDEPFVFPGRAGEISIDGEEFKISHMGYKHLVNFIMSNYMDEKDVAELRHTIQEDSDIIE